MSLKKKKKKKKKDLIMEPGLISTVAQINQ